MNFLIPMMGKGNRFVAEGYSNPKPLINFNGEPIILHVIKAIPKEARTITCVVSKELIASGIGVVLSYLYDPRIRVICLPEDTMGAAHTALLACDHLDMEEPVCVIDCDIIPDTSVLSRWCGNTINTVFYHTDEARSGLFSYLVTDNQDVIASIVEKEPISDKACSGIYAFEYSSSLRYYAKLIVERGVKTKGEFYMSQVIHEAAQEEVFRAVPSGNYKNLGTPAQIKMAYKEMQHEPKRLCFDVDATIMSAPAVKGEYQTCGKVKRNIDYINNLYAAGHYIILVSARGMLSYQANIADIEFYVRPVMERKLAEFGVKYHELHLGKPYADLYFDDKAVNVNIPDMEKASGIYLSLDTPARSFNNVVENDGKIIKRGESVKHEVNFYYSMPPALSQYFPKIIYAEGGGYVMEKIEGVSFSELYLRGRLTSGDFVQLLETFAVIHQPLFYDGSLKPDTPELLYSAKTIERYRSHFDFYKQFPNSDRLISAFAYVEMSTDITIMHGDPVFTNVFLTKEHQIKLIDPRGNINGEATIYGDPLYDIAKIVQSIIGYDHALTNATLPDKYKTKMLQVLFEYLGRPMYDPQIMLRVAHLLFSLLPLHKEDMERCKRFYKLLEEVHENLKSLPAGN